MLCGVEGWTINWLTLLQGIERPVLRHLRTQCILYMLMNEASPHPREVALHCSLARVGTGLYRQKPGEVSMATPARTVLRWGCSKGHILPTVEAGILALMLIGLLSTYPMGSSTPLPQPVPMRMGLSPLPPAHPPELAHRTQKLEAVSAQAGAASLPVSGSDAFPVALEGRVWAGGAQPHPHQGWALQLYQTLQYKAPSLTVSQQR